MGEGAVDTHRAWVALGDLRHNLTVHKWHDWICTHEYTGKSEHVDVLEVAAHVDGDDGGLI